MEVRCERGLEDWELGPNGREKPAIRRTTRITQSQRNKAKIPILTSIVQGLDGFVTGEMNSNHKNCFRHIDS